MVAKSVDCSHLWWMRAVGARKSDRPGTGSLLLVGDGVSAGVRMQGMILDGWKFSKCRSVGLHILIITLPLME